MPPLTSEQNQRRFELIQKQVRGSLDAAETLELRDLQQQSLKDLNERFPLPPLPKLPRSVRGLLRKLRDEQKRNVDN